MESWAQALATGAPETRAPHLFRFQGPNPAPGIVGRIQFIMEAAIQVNLGREILRIKARNFPKISMNP